ncbi:20208_t:CDS:1, partial [Racocetra persica]
MPPNQTTLHDELDLERQEMSDVTATIENTKTVDNQFVKDNSSSP